tara:strand:+ start:206 stop:553 length:348 start_codon:yes stop_codon:yes gene_type:complete
MQDKKRDNVVGIGHNRNFSEDKYNQLVQYHHKIMSKVKSLLYDAKWNYDEAFTKRFHANITNRKLDVHEVHEKRLMGKQSIEQSYSQLKYSLEKLEATAKAEGVDLGIDEVSDEK